MRKINIDVKEVDEKDLIGMPTEVVNSNIVKHTSFIERHPRYEFTPLKKEDFEIGEWTESSPEYDNKCFNYFNDPTMMKTFTLKFPFSSKEVPENFLGFNLFYLNCKSERSWKGVPKIQSKRQKIKDEMFDALRKDTEENCELYISVKIAEVNASIQKVIDRLNKEYEESNSEMLLNAFDRIDTCWIKEEIYDYSEEEKEEKVLKDKIEKLRSELNVKRKARYQKVNLEIANYLERDEEALEAIDKELRKDICQKLRHESPKMPISIRR